MVCSDPNLKAEYLSKVSDVLNDIATRYELPIEEQTSESRVRTPVMTDVARTSELDVDLCDEEFVSKPVGETTTNPELLLRAMVSSPQEDPDIHSRHLGLEYEVSRHLNDNEVASLLLQLRQERSPSTQVPWSFDTGARRLWSDPSALNRVSPQL